MPSFLLTPPPLPPATGPADAKRSPSPSQSGSAPITLEGKLVFKNTHASEIWTLRTAAGAVYRLSAGQPLDSQLLPLPAGSRVSLVSVCVRQLLVAGCCLESRVQDVAAVMSSSVNRWLTGE